METVQKDKVGFKNSEGGNEGAVSKTVVLEFTPPPAYVPPEGYVRYEKTCMFGVNRDFLSGGSSKPVRLESDGNVEFFTDAILVGEVRVLRGTELKRAGCSEYKANTVRLDLIHCQVYVKK